MCEFWSQGYGFRHRVQLLRGRLDRAHARPSDRRRGGVHRRRGEAWRQYPGSMKAQGDWALCTGINRFVFHRYQHQPWLDRWPGMTMGPYGVHWERTQTWWDMVAGVSHLPGPLPADAPARAARGRHSLSGPRRRAARLPAARSRPRRGNPPDRRGYNFDGCVPDTLIERASVKDGRIVLPDGMSYRVLVLPCFDTMTPGLLRQDQGPWSRPARR